jgi:hypothetical protein
MTRGGYNNDGGYNDDREKTSSLWRIRLLLKLVRLFILVPARVQAAGYRIKCGMTAERRKD